MDFLKGFQSKLMAVKQKKEKADHDIVMQQITVEHLSKKLREIDEKRQEYVEELKNEYRKNKRLN